jgi:MoxR-like ATPase
MFSLWMTYPSAVEEEKIAISTTQMAFPEVQQVVGLDQILALQQLVRRMPVSQHIVSYAVALARASRPQEPEASGYVRQYVTWGAGPRASQYLLLGARALAVLDGQPTVSAAHVREVAPLVLRHRILPNYHATGEGITAVDIVAQIISETAEPVYGR